MKIFWIGLIGLVGLGFSPTWPLNLPLSQNPSPPASQIDESESFWIPQFMRAAPANQSCAAIGPVFGNSFPKFHVHNPEIVWAAPTNQSRAALWIYKVVPQHFSSSAISNLVVMGGFTMKDEQHGHDKITNTNEDTLFFFSKDRICNLTVVPPQGRIEYWNGLVLPNHWDKTNHLVEPVEGLPDETKVEKLGLKLLNQFGIQRDDLAQRTDGHLITFGEKETRGYFDRRSKKYIDDEVIARGIFFNRRIDGVNFAGIGAGGGCQIKFSNHAKIADFRLVWRNLQPYKQYRVASPDEILSYIRDGQAVLTHKNLVNPADVKKLTITDCSPLYMGADGKEAQDLVYPFAQVEAVADLGTSSTNIQLYCPILSTNLIE